MWYIGVIESRACIRLQLQVNPPMRIKRILLPGRIPAIRPIARVGPLAGVHAPVAGEVPRLRRRVGAGRPVTHERALPGVRPDVPLQLARARRLERALRAFAVGEVRCRWREATLYDQN